MNNNRSRAVVIGGGISGLATAALLAKQGWQVTLLEKNATFGGRARVLKTKGFSFDMGPSWYMMPEVFETFFAEFGKKSSDFYQLIRLDPRYQAVFGDGSKVTLSDNLKQNHALFESIETGAGKQLQKFLSKTQRIYQLATTRLIYQDLWSLKAVVNLENGSDLIKLLTTLKFWRSWDSEVSSYFTNDKLKKILGFPAVFLGGSPFNTPALYTVLAWADFGKGIWYPKGGMGKVVEALTTLAVSSGVELITQAEVVAIEVNQGRVVGVKTKTKHYSADVVVAAADMPWIETQLLPKKYQSYNSSYWQQKTMGISAMLMYLGMNKKLKNPVHHTIYFSKDWQQNFTQIFTNKTLPTDPSLYISVRTATDPSIAPKNNEEIFVLVPVAADSSYNPTQLKAFEKQVIGKLETILEEKLTDKLLVKKVFTPNDFKTEYNAYQGTALGLAHTLKQSLWFRPDQRSRKVKGLYYAGQYTNPGVGVPMALISAQIVAKQIGDAENRADTIFKKGSTTYYYSSLFFKGQVKKDVFNLYAYVRLIDDCVDSTKPDLKRFEQLWKDTLTAWNGDPVKDLVVTRFVELAKRKDFKWQWVEAFWQAMRSDLTKTEYTSFAELEEYMYGSAEVIGLMMAKIMDLREKAMKAAAKQGKAMQFVNFIRDVKEDEELGRNYLGYTQAQKNDPTAWNAFINKQLRLYFKLQQEAEKGYRYLPKQYLVPIKTAADMYTWTAKQIQKQPALVWQTKIKPKKYRVLAQLLKNYLESR